MSIVVSIVVSVAMWSILAVWATASVATIVALARANRTPEMWDDQ